MNIHGNSHYCDECGVKWYDSDGGCECHQCVKCGEWYSEKKLNDDEVCCYCEELE